MNSNMMITLVWLGAFAMVVLTVYFIMRFRSITPERIPAREKGESWDWQKPGIVVLGIGLGALVVGLLNSFKSFHLHGSVSVGIIVIFTGISLIVAQKFDKNDCTED